MSIPILELSDIHAAYIRKEILRGVSLTVRAGEMVALLGENGSGKSTTLKVVSGFLSPTRGSVIYKGHSIDNLSVTDRQRLGVGYLMQGGRVFPNLSVQENFHLAASGAIRNGSPARLGDWFPPLRARGHDRAGLLSGGQRQMLAIELVLSQQPDVLLLDEPAGALTEELAAGILRTISQYVASKSVAALLVEQNAQLARETCARTLHIKQGVLLDSCEVTQ
jgi:ABC-type branched-subunit amino acid transport system ATPase component